MSPTTSVTIDVNANAGLEINCPSVVCQSLDPVQYCTDYQHVTCTNYTWTVNGGTPQGTTTGNCLDVTWNAPLPNGYGYVSLLATGCTPSGVCPWPVTVEVPVIPPLPIVTGASGLCDPNAKNIRYSVPNWPGATYAWTYIIDQNQTGGTVTIVGSGHEILVNLQNFYGKFRIQVAVTHPIAECNAVGELAVSVQDYQINGNGSCYGSGVALSIVPTPPFTNYSVAWKVIETNSLPLTVSNLPDVTLPFSAFGNGGIFTVKAVVTPGNGQPPFECDNLYRTINIANEVQPVTSILGPRKFCIPSNQSYTADPLGGSLKWTVVGGAFDGAFVANTVKVNWTATQPPYSLSVTRTLSGCTSAPYKVSDFTNITGQGPVISGPIMPCEGAVSNYASDIDGATTYTWTISPSTAGSITSGEGTSQIQIQWHSFGAATVNLTALICNVQYPVNLPVQVIHNSVSINCPTGDPSNCHLCQATDYIFTTTNDNGSYYKWFVDGASTPAEEGATAKTFTKSFESAGTHFIRIEMTGPASCPGTFGDVLSVEVVPNPQLAVFPSDVLDCSHLATLTLNATNWPGASQEVFFWSLDNATPQDPPYTPNGSQLTINSSQKDDYLKTFHVRVERTLANNLVCVSEAAYTPTCSDGEILPQDDPRVDFDWDFTLDVPNLDCQPIGANECGYIKVTGQLSGGKSIGDLDFASQECKWVVQDAPQPFNMINPNPVGINFPIQFLNTGLSVFSRAGFYPTALRVKFIGDGNIYGHVEVLEIPLVPDITSSYACSGSGNYSLTLLDASETVPDAIIHQRQWAVRINGGTTQIINDNVPQITLTVPAGATIEASLTAFTHTVGLSKPGMEYYCTRCISINLPPSPMISIVADREVACNKVAIHFSTVTTPLNEPIVSYTWAFGDGAVDHSPNPVRTYVSPGNYTVTLTATTQRGCELVVTKDIEILPTPTVGGTLLLTYMDCHSSAVLTYMPAANTTIPDVYLWNPGGTTTVGMLPVMSSGTYALTVTDNSTGCTFSPGSQTVAIQSLFPGGLTGDFISCVGTNLMFTYSPTSNYTFEWETNIIGTVTISIAGNKLTVKNALSGTYYIQVTAYDENHIACTTIEKTVIIHPLPSTPVLLVDYQTCKPFEAHITNNLDTTLFWSGPNGNIGFSTDIFVNEGGQYTAVATDQYGCKKDAIVLVDNAIDVSILTGCYTICDTLLKKKNICLPAPSGTYTSWAWQLLPNNTPPLPSGTGAVTPLCLDASMAGKIVLTLTKQYHSQNPPPNGSNLDCTETSDPFCLTVSKCETCPPLTMNYLSVIAGNGAPVVCGSYNEHVYHIKGSFILPAGYVTCGQLPTLTGGYLNFTQFASAGPSILQFDGFLHVTDFIDFENGGLSGSLILCNSTTGEKCPVTFTIPNIPCMPGMTFNCNPSTTSTIWGPWTTNQSNNVVKVKYCFNLHYVPGTTCSLTQYTVRIMSPTTPSVLLKQEIFTAPQLPGDAYQCLEFLVDKTKWTAFGGCANVSIQSNCLDFGCSFNNFCGFYGDYGLQGDGSEDRSDNSLVPIATEDFLNVMPNPTNDLLTIAYYVSKPTSGSRIIVTNGLGQLVHLLDIEQPGGSEQMDVSTWPSGLYFVHLQEGNHLTKSKKVVVQH